LLDGATFMCGYYRAGPGFSKRCRRDKGPRGGADLRTVRLEFAVALPLCATQKRTPKLSAAFYREVAAGNRVV
jgi:hypothetical protein